jgi:DNA-binding transcriptional MerR regulator
MIVFGDFPGLDWRITMSTAHVLTNPNLAQFLHDQARDTEAIGIGEMARQYSTTLRTLRFYESRGLLSPRREGVNRYYDINAQRRFRLIDEGRKLGFTLTEIAELLGPVTNVGELKLTVQKIMDQIAHLEQQRRDIETALSSLRRRYYMMTDPGYGED